MIRKLRRWWNWHFQPKALPDTKAKDKPGVRLALHLLNSEPRSELE